MAFFDPGSDGAGVADIDDTGLGVRALGVAGGRDRIEALGVAAAKGQRDTGRGVGLREGLSDAARRPGDQDGLRSQQCVVICDDVPKSSDFSVNRTNCHRVMVQPAI